MTRGRAPIESAALKALTAISFTLLVAGVAYAGDPKAGAPGQPPDKKAPDAKAEKVAEPPKEAPKPPAELADMAKGMAGTWTCTGQADLGGKLVDVKGTIVHKVDLDGWWIASTLTGTAGKLTMHSTFLTTYDAAMKKFYRSTANGRGGHATLWGTQSDMKLSWEGDSRVGGNDVKLRGGDEMVSAKEVHVAGEYSKDGGKTWSKDHDVTCKK